MDVVLSGINHGLNLGNAIWHSGTVAAARQAALLGIPGVALSAPIQDETADLDAIDPWLERALSLVLDEDVPGLINVNFPLRPRGMRWTTQAVGRYDGAGTDPMGREHYWFTVVPLEHHAEGTDAWAVANDYVSLMPLHLDLTDRAALATRSR